MTNQKLKLLHRVCLIVVTHCILCFEGEHEVCEMESYRNKSTPNKSGKISAKLIRRIQALPVSGKNSTAVIPVFLIDNVKCIIVHSQVNFPFEKLRLSQACDHIK